MSELTYAGASVTGIRDQNEDRWIADPEAGLFIVSDGIGGAHHGELAAQAVVDLVPERVAAIHHSGTCRDDPETLLGTAVAELSDELNHRGERDPRLAGTGATIVAALITDSHCTIAHLGDSPAFLLHDGRLTRLTTDHTMARVLLDAGAITADDALKHPGRNKLTRYFGMSSPVDPDATRVELHPGDRLLLCTDGISGVLSEEALRTRLGSGDPLDTICAALIDDATHAHSPDNMTVLVVDFRFPPTD